MENDRGKELRGGDEEDHRPDAYINYPLLIRETEKRGLKFGHDYGTWLENLEIGKRTLQDVFRNPIRTYSYRVINDLAAVCGLEWKDLACAEPILPPVSVLKSIQSSARDVDEEYDGATSSHGRKRATSSPQGKTASSGPAAVPLMSSGIVEWRSSRRDGEVRAFLHEQLESTPERGRELQIDAMGVKLVNVSDFLLDEVPLRRLSGAVVRFLVLAEGDGAAQRAALEERSWDGMQKVLRGGYGRVPKLIERFGDSVEFVPKLYDFSPAYYLVRVNGRMLVSFYLDNAGHDSPFVIVNADSSLFGHFLGYFNWVFGHASGGLWGDLQRAR